MSDQKTPSETTVPPTERAEHEHEHEQSKTQADADTGADNKTDNNNNNNNNTATAEGDNVQSRLPNQLRSHYKGMPRQWEKNRNKFPPKDE
ncbi:hypothetical protein F4809DRAFT_637184 [Biscogniauxia mediterranea]|nr:hypothetical protein F4809DRAFT_637184 [Biscogniauxia mediterranea]